MSQPRTDTVELIIPCRPEYVGVARLTVLGIASPMSFSYDEVEDIRLAVGEACTHAVERAGASDARIHITSSINARSLVIEVADNVPVGTTPREPSQEAQLLLDSDVDVQGLGALLMEILVDEVKITSNSDGTIVRLTKFAPE